jgi:amidase
MGLTQGNTAVGKPYREALGGGAARLKIAVIEEGFGHSESSAPVDAVVREASERFKGLGASVETVSIPMHRLGGPSGWRSRPKARLCK